MKTAEKILNDRAIEHKRKYASFCALIENESSVDVFDIAIKAMEKYADQIESLYKDEIEVKNFQIVQEHKIIAMLAEQVDRLKELVKTYDELKHYQFRMDTNIDEAKESRMKMAELRHKIEQLRNEVEL